MLFDPRPKESRRDLFDREEELARLEEYTGTGAPLVLCLGVRRIGKTSVLKVFINESDKPAVYIDARRLAEAGYTRQGLYRLLSEGFNKLRGRRAILDYLEKIRGVRIAGYGVEFDWRSREPLVSTTLEKMDDYARDHGTVFMLVIDEAQYLRLLRGYNKIDFREIIAYSYDNLRRVKIILAGSEIGLLYRFLGLEDATSPLYGRVRDEVILERFTREQSIEFLERGFEEARVRVSKEIIEEAVEKLDGIPGWLAYFGYKLLEKRRPEALRKVLREAISLALSELRKLQTASPLYIQVLRAIAMGYTKWSSIRRAVEAWTGRALHQATLYRVLRGLEDMSIIAKRGGEYVFLDPIYSEASKQL